MKRGHDQQPSTPALTALGGQVSRRAEVIQVLREALVAGELVPGEVYSAPALAKQLNVSATPVREAMLSLAEEGLVLPLRHRGYQIVELDMSSLAHVTEVRLMLEVPAVHRIATEAGAGAHTARISALRPLADRLDSTAAAGELREFIAADTAFHLGLLELSDNPVLVEDVRRLRGMTRLYGLRALRDQGRLEASAHEHHELLDLILAGDAPGAAALLTRHLNHILGIWAGNDES
ncbi:GntR family transcriptional regulator [Tsukamurella asaccharolytica]|uniref:GntR family transcriptional regulator n=1 Tax=Tsukamurella asaccharolytica TaxID=2592067 RepID=A0A5C5RE35_9ACTN|nr:GntR family transcriptional regulator [Tsukamurella asaccharolytica]TWS21110.1 GntR family transcriptional regulator [Tsukamurella asaccharolytica]